MAKAALQRIESIARELHSRRKIPMDRYEHIERCCIILWGKSNQVGTSPRIIKAASRERQAQKIYGEVMERNCHMLLPFMLAISPRACEGFLYMQEINAKFSTFRLNLETESKEFLKRIAIMNNFHNRPAYINLMESLFPAGLLQSPFVNK